MNGYGERTGNADLVPIAANLVLKMDADCLPEGAVERLTEVAHYVAEVANVAPDSRQPYAGRFAFTHKAGLHASGVARFSEAYEHVAPDAVGNRRGVVASDLGGGRHLEDEGRGVRPRHRRRRRSRGRSTELKEREARGYTFEVADASLELLLRRASGWSQPFFEVDSYRVHVEERVGDGEPPLAEATVKVLTKGTRHIESAEGHGPVGALDDALRKALTNDYPELEHIELEDYRVRVLAETHGTGAVVRVLIDTSNGERSWTTVGVSENIIEASWEALTDAYLYGLLHPREVGEGVTHRPAAARLAWEDGTPWRCARSGRSPCPCPGSAATTSDAGSTRSRTREVIDAAFEVGATLFDTADLYGDTASRSSSAGRSRAARRGRGRLEVRDADAAGRDDGRRPALGPSRVRREPPAPRHRPDRRLPAARARRPDADRGHALDDVGA